MEEIKIQNRIPYEYFVTSGKGESNLGIHTGSFDKALSSAGIGDQNIMIYSSIMPPVAKKIKKVKLSFGSVTETIMAVKNGEKGERLTAGIGIAWVYKGNKKIGGLVAEYSGNDSKKDARKKLFDSLLEMYITRFGENKAYKIKKIEMKIESFKPKKKYGTVLVAICFTSHIIPRK